MATSSNFTIGGLKDQPSENFVSVTNFSPQNQRSIESFQKHQLRRDTSAFSIDNSMLDSGQNNFEKSNGLALKSSTRFGPQRITPRFKPVLQQPRFIQESSQPCNSYLGTTYSILPYKPIKVRDEISTTFYPFVSDNMVLPGQKLPCYKNRTLQKITLDLQSVTASNDGKVLAISDNLK